MHKYVSTFVPERVIKFLLMCIFGLLVLQLINLVLYHGFGYDRAMGYIPLTRMDGERNLPTLYSTLQLALCAALIFLVAKTQENKKFHWYLLSFVFMFLTGDEYIGFHEMVAVSRSTSNPELTAQFAWLIPYLLGVALFLVIFIPFLLSLPRRTAVLFCVAGGLFVGAAVGLEAVTGMMEEAGYSINDIRQRSVATLEEFLEMTSIALFIYSMLDMLRAQNLNVKISATND